MPAKTDTSLAQEQIKIKPKIDEMIPKLLGGALQEAAFEFVAYLSEKKNAPRYSSFNSWKVSYKSKMLCYIKMNSNIWSVAFHLEKFNREFSEDFKETVQNNLASCTACLKACRKGVEMTVFEKRFENICHYWTIRFVNPNVNTLKHIKELLEYRKKIIRGVF